MSRVRCTDSATTRVVRASGGKAAIGSSCDSASCAALALRPGTARHSLGRAQSRGQVFALMEYEVLTPSAWASEKAIAGMGVSVRQIRALQWRRDTRPAA